MEIVARKENKTIWVLYICLICVLALCFVTAILIFLAVSEGWVVFAWCALILIPPLPIPWCMLFAYLATPSVLAEFDGTTLRLNGRREKQIPVNELRNATILHLNGTLFSRTVILIVTSDKKKYKIKYAQEPSAVVRRLEELARG